MVNTTTIAELGALMGDPGRVNMLVALFDGRALTARELADRAGVTPQTASGHLARLVAAGLLCVEKQGRHRYHRLSSADVAALLEAMHVAGARVESLRPARRIGPIDADLRRARSCYDHLAGTLSVALADVLTGPRRGDDTAGLSEQGEAMLGAWGIDMATLRNSKRPFYRSCLDWSERRPHAAGAIGAAVLDRCLSLGWLRRRTGSRALTISRDGEAGLLSVFGIVCDAYGETSMRD